MAGRKAKTRLISSFCFQMPRVIEKIILGVLKRRSFCLKIKAIRRGSRPRRI